MAWPSRSRSSSAEARSRLRKLSSTRRSATTAARPATTVRVARMMRNVFFSRSNAQRPRPAAGPGAPTRRRIIKPARRAGPGGLPDDLLPLLQRQHRAQGPAAADLLAQAVLALVHLDAAV